MNKRGNKFLICGQDITITSKQISKSWTRFTKTREGILNLRERILYSWPQYIFLSTRHRTMLFRMKMVIEHIMVMDTYGYRTYS